MNTDEIVRALRNCKAYKTKSDLQTTMLMAADCIETLQAQLAEQQAANDALRREVPKLAMESVERDMELAKLEAEVMVWAKAEQEGRLVVLPCKVGDTVYEALLEWDCTECLKTSFKPKVRERKVTHFMFGKSGDIIVGVAGDGADYLIYGKTVFLAREEAEEALKGESHD